MFETVLRRASEPLHRRTLLPVLGFIAVAMLLGGGGAGYPLAEMVVELFAIGLLLRAALARSESPRGRAYWAVVAIFGAAAALVLVQIAPLPPSYWHALPSRTIAVAVYQALGWDRMWHAASLTPDRTVLDGLALLPAFASFVTVAALSVTQRSAVLRALAVVGVLATLLGAIQLAAGPESAPSLYDTIHRGFGTGLFVNRNHQAAMLLSIIVLAAVSGVVRLGTTPGEDDGAITRRRMTRPVSLIFTGFLALGVLATNSRTGIALLPLALLIAISLTFMPMRGEGARGPWRRYGLPGAVLAYCVVAAALYPTVLVQQALARFATTSEDLRYQYWENTRFAIGETWPWGSGFGSFDTVYRSVEPLAQVLPAWVNHAHNDYLEIVLEGGVAGVILMIAASLVALLAFAAAIRRARGRSDKALAIAGAAGIALILLCSVVDFPLRMSAVGVLLGAMVALAVPAPRAIDEAAEANDAADAGASPAPAPSVPPIAAVAGLVIALSVGWLSLSGGLALYLARAGAPAAATQLAPWSARAWAELANERQLAGQASESSEAGLRALAIAPLHVEALRAVASAALAQQREMQGATLMQLGGALGWRDTVTQLWLARRALEVRNLPVAVERIDGMLRRGVEQPLMQRQLRAVLLYPGGGDAIVARLALRAPWRQGFLNAVAEDSPRAVPQVLALLEAMRRAGVPAAPMETALIRWRLADAGDFDAVRAVWRVSGGRGLIGDPGFADAAGVLPAGAAPFQWYAPARLGMHLTVVEPDSGSAHTARSLLISSDGFNTGPALAQTVALEPGTYRLIVTPHRADGREQTGPTGVWTLTCRRPGVPEVASPIALAPGGPAGGWTGVVTVPVDCPGQTLTLIVPENRGAAFTLSLDAVRIVRAGVTQGLTTHLR